VLRLRGGGGPTTFSLVNDLDGQKVQIDFGVYSENHKLVDLRAAIAKTLGLDPTLVRLYRKGVLITDLE
jgi:hypothetical protein